MRISGLLSAPVAKARFGCLLEPLRSILHTRLERLAAKSVERPTPPTWREREASAKLHATGGAAAALDSAGDDDMVDGAEWKYDLRLELMLAMIGIVGGRYSCGHQIGGLALSCDPQPHQCSG
ncbi:MAG TPA: hypothetical protein VKQ36_04470 [Ktedonobacterales bacterium]|nr:hypothetical protein [Ktedonobacterales bacterium]